MKRTRLERRTPLRANPDKRLKASSPIKSIGKRGRRLAPARAASKASVRKRSGGRCELYWHGVRCTNPASDWHHLIRRIDAVEDRPEVTVDACRICHDRWHRGDREFIAENRLRAGLGGGLAA